MDIDNQVMWCGHTWHHYGHWWTNYNEEEWYCDGVD